MLKTTAFHTRLLIHRPISVVESVATVAKDYIRLPENTPEDALYISRVILLLSSFSTIEFTHAVGCVNTSVAQAIQVRLNLPLTYSVVNRPVRNICRTDGTAPRPSVPSSPAEDGMSADDGRGRQKCRHRALTINTYTVTVKRVIQDINGFFYISRLTISSKHSGLV